jgi:hypothetical protein
MLAKYMQQQNEILSEFHIYLERELESKKWSQLCVNRADKNNRKGLELTSNSAFNFRHLGREPKFRILTSI